ncbi:MAG: NAD-dependent protein deacylase [Bacilli bacterium]|nr:NAD-dependent protein deacylase [Bacilli bacterium]MBO4682427.1 NAD-dependent protein deacylase [Bacilli bacterium]
MDKYEILNNMINHSRNIVFFTGAGISVPSGIPDFRSADGLYNEKREDKIRPEDIISHSFYMAHKELFYSFYKNKMMYLEAKPNAAHKWIAELEKNKQVTVVTQNIDGLHSLAGSQNVVEIHGSIHRNYCERCNKFFDAKYVHDAEGVPHCDKCGGDIKPDVVLYEESLNEEEINRAINAIMQADTLVVIGTSLSVYPAAGFIRYFRGSCLILLNKSSTSYDNMADLVINEDIVKIIEKLNEKNN